MPREGKIGRRRATPKLRTGYDTGEPAINLCLAVLACAKRDASKTIPDVMSSKYYQTKKALILSAKRMWQAFTETDFYGKRSIGPLEITWWILNYIKEVKYEGFHSVED